MQRLFIVIITLAIIDSSLPCFAQESIKLPEPVINNDLMKALRDRSTYRNFNPRPLSRQTIAEVLWAGYGINNKKTGRRTVGTAFNMREMSIYVLTGEGGFLYNAEDHVLVQITGEDLRPIIATQDYAVSVPLHLVYVADNGLVMKQSPEWAHEIAGQFSIMHTGQIAQNIYLYCALNGLGTVIRNVVNKDDLGKKLGLHPNQRIIASQVVGYPEQ